MSIEQDGGPVLTSAEAWLAYLPGYGRQFVETANEYIAPSIDERQRETGWFGREPAGEAALVAVEQRLGVALPPSFRAFLSATDGWSGVGGWIDEIFGCADLGWFRDNENGASLIELYGEDDGNEEIVELFERSLVVAGGEDHWLLDPSEIGPDGEWKAVEFQPKYGELEEFPGFAALVIESYDVME